MVKRKIIFCSESRGLTQYPAKPPEKYSIDGEAIMSLFKNNMMALRSESVEMEAIGFVGKENFMEKVPNFVRNKFAEFRSRSQEIEIFLIALRDADTNDGKKISSLRRKLTEKIKKLVDEQEFKRVRIMFAVQAIEAWILADEKKLNEYLKVTNIKHENEPEKIGNPKLIIQNHFERCGRKYTSQELLPLLQAESLLRGKHFRELYTCVQQITEASVQ